MRKMIYLSLVLYISFTNILSAGTYSGGDGSQGNPYLIANANDMQEIGATPADWGKHFLMTADIDLSQFTGTQFNIIGTYPPENPFTGVFDGDNHTISNFTYDTSIAGCIGIFGSVEGNSIYSGGPWAQIKNLGLIDPNVNETEDGFVGSLAGMIKAGVMISNCYVKGGSVSCGGTSGGTGGLVGLAYYDSSISNCYTTCNVSGYDYVGGLAGSAMGDHATISHCYTTGNISGHDHVGGLVGEYAGSGISYCYTTGSVSGSNCGGLVGFFGGGCSISNSYSTACASGNSTVGGLIGHIDASSSASKCYAAGAVSGNSTVGGLIGSKFSSGAITNCYWDINSTGQSTSVGGTGKTTAQMKQQATFTNWDFIDTWDIGENQTYPYITIYPAGDLNHDGIVNMQDFAILANHWLEDNNP